MYKRPRESFQMRYRRQREGHDLTTIAVPSAMIGLVLVIAFTLIYVVVIRGPDTHANLWNEARPDYKRTEVSFVPPLTAPLSSSPSTSEEASFSRDILPLLQAKCIVCHGAMGFSAKGISLTSYEILMSTVVEGQAIITPGDLDSSLLLQVLRRGVLYMPPSGRLTEEKIELIEKWITQGAQNN